MLPERIAELLEPFLGDASDQRPPANDDLYQHISTYIDILLRWNARVNLTAIRNEDEIVTRHFGESLFAARHLFPKVPHVAGAQSPKPSAARLADLGSGAGFPGIPIKLWAPDLFVTLIESNHKKATFLREVVRSLALTEITVRNSRAEALPGEIFEILTLRAVDRISAILPVAGNLLVAGGRWRS